MSGLSDTLVEHKLPIKEGFKPFQQAPRKIRAETQILVKEEVEKMYKSGVIRVVKYNEWLSNVVPVKKKNGKIRVCGLPKS